MTPSVTLRRAHPADADALARISKRAFDSDFDLGAPGPGGPPGYDDPGWQVRMMRFGDYYAVVRDGGLVGGAIVIRTAPGEYELGRLFVDPDLHRMGIGSQAVTLLAVRYPLASRWTLDTPTWNPRTRRFYERLGFTPCGRRMLGGGFELPLYERQQRLDRDPAFRAAFAALTPGRQREYHLHVAGAKQATTRHSRIDAIVPRVLAGKGLRDR